MFPAMPQTATGEGEASSSAPETGHHERLKEIRASSWSCPHPHLSPFQPHIPASPPSCLHQVVAMPWHTFPLPHPKFPNLLLVEVSLSACLLPLGSRSRSTHTVETGEWHSQAGCKETAPAPVTLLVNSDPGPEGRGDLWLGRGTG